jgi:predicted ATPase
MNNVDHITMYGRVDEIDCLQGILASVFQEAISLDQPSKENGCFGDCNCSAVTESSSNSEGDDPANGCDEIPVVHQRSKTACDGIGGGRCQFVLVSGPPGVGKRTLIANALSRLKLGERKSPFIVVSTRIHSAKKAVVKTGPNRPFSSILEAIQELARVVSDQSVDMRIAVHKKLRVLLKNPEDTSSLCELIPCVKKWLHDEDMIDSPHDSSPDDLERSKQCMVETKPSGNGAPFVPGAQLALQQTQAWLPLLQIFLHAVVSITPVVLLLEDFQYADETSLKLINDMLRNSKTGVQQQEALKGLLLVASYSDVDDVPAPHSLLSLIESTANDNPHPSTPTEVGCQSHSKNIHHIVVNDLTWDDINEWVHDCGGVIQQCSANDHDAITDIVFRHSNGNPLRIRFLLHFLEKENALLREPIHKKRIPSKLEDLYTILLLRQDVSIQKAVQATAVLARYGDYEVHLEVLEIALTAPCLDIIEAARCIGLIEYSVTRPSLFFRRESFQNVTYNTIPNSTSLCLEIGRRIWSSTILSEGKKEVSDEKVIARVFLSTQLLQNCVDLLSDIDERIYMSQLCYETGLKASSLGNFRTSVKLFEFAICVLGSELWRNDLYDASLVLHNATAQAYCYVADYENMKRTLDLIFDNAKTFGDKMPAYLIMVYSSGSGHQLLETQRISSMVLQELGEPVSDNPCTITVLSYLRMVKWTLQRKTDRFLCNLPIADDTDHRIKTQIHCFMMFTGYMAFPNRAIFLCCRLILSSIKDGICGPSAMAFSSYAFFMSGRGDFEVGHRIGQLVLQFSERFGAWWPRLHTLIYGYVNHWTYPIRDSLEPLKRIQRASLLFGDLEIYAVSSNLYIKTAFYAGVSLRVLEPSAQLLCRSLSAVGQKNQLLSFLQLWSLMNDLQGGKNRLELDGDINNTSSALKHCIKEGNKIMTGNFCIYHTIWYYIIGDYKEALLMAKKAFKQRKIYDYTLTFYEGLAALATAWTSKSCSQRRSIALGKKSAKYMKRWANRCPENFRNKQLLLEAELAALNGKSSQARSLFNQSILKANHETFIHEEAIAYERLGHFQRRIGNVAEAKFSFASARSAYEKWGASILVDRMDDLLKST